MDLVSERAYNTPATNSTLFPLLILSLAHQKNSPDTVSKIEPSYDYIIVGAGAAGSAVAARLSEIPCVRILILEAGPPPPIINDVLAYARSFWFTDLDWQYKTVSQKHTGKGLRNNQLTWPSGKALGGTTILNGGIFVRGNRKDYDSWAEGGATGWSFDDVLPYFKKLEDNQNREYVEDGFYDYQAASRNSQRCSTAKAYLVPAENRANLDILSNAHVRKVIFTNGSASGVLFDHDGQTHLVNSSREVILSAGAINTAQVLLLSGIGPREELEKHGIPVIADLPVGKNLQDHGGTAVNFVFRPEIKPIGEKFSDDKNIKRYIVTRTGPLAAPTGVSSVAFLQDDSIDPPEDAPNYELYFLESTTIIPKNDWNLNDEVYEAVYKPYESKPIMTCFVQQLHPKSRGSVTLQSSNPYDPPLIDPNYLSYSEEVDDLVEGMKTCRRITNNRYMQRVISSPFSTIYPGCENYTNDDDAYLKCQARTEIYTLSHPAGTAKMGDPMDNTTVVDTKLRVKFVKGLRVVDNSIMPSIIRGNTGVPAMMIGEKAADIIKQGISCLKNFH